MTSERKRSNEFKRYRQVLVAVYVGTAAAGLLLLAASVVRDLFFRTPAVELPQSSIVAGKPRPRDLLECNDLVREQLFILSAKTNELFQRPLQGDREGLASDWKDFSTKWRDQWDVVNARCRFTELADTTMGEAFDRMAHVHEALPAIRLKYNSLLADFDREQADELAEMRRALDTSLASITRNIESRPRTPPPSGEVP